MKGADTGLPVWIEGTDGPVESHGWMEHESTWGWSYSPPVVSCRVCVEAMTSMSPLVVAGVTVVGGVHSLLWHMRCVNCNRVVTYPATDFSDE